MRLSDASALPSASRNRLTRPVLAAVTLALMAVIALLDLKLAPNAPISHLYYIPILVAAVTLGRRWALAASALAIVLFHLADPALANLHYAEADILQVVLFATVGWVAARLADDKRELRRLAATDDLTGLGNLRSFESDCREIIEQARANGGPVALISLDVDKLKLLNDAHGHLAGADAVKTVGTIIGRELPAAARACRYGGDEFAIVIANGDAFEAQALAAQIRAAVGVTTPILDSAQFGSGTLSVSTGVACSRVKGSTSAGLLFADLFREADAAMYRAKRAYASSENADVLVTPRRTKAPTRLAHAQVVHAPAAAAQLVAQAPDTPAPNFKVSRMHTGAIPFVAARRSARRKELVWALLGALVVLVFAGLSAVSVLADSLWARLLFRS